MSGQAESTYSYVELSWFGSTLNQVVLGPGRLNSIEIRLSRAKIELSPTGYGSSRVQVGSRRTVSSWVCVQSIHTSDQSSQSHIKFNLINKVDLI